MYIVQCVTVAFCKGDQAALAINSANASAANEVKHRYRNLFQLAICCFSLQGGRAEVRKERYAVCAGNGWSDTG